MYWLAFTVFDVFKSRQDIYFIIIIIIYLFIYFVISDNCIKPSVEVLGGPVRGEDIWKEEEGVTQRSKCKKNILMYIVYISSATQVSLRQVYSFL